jgi:hypothetical protein
MILRGRKIAKDLRQQPPKNSAPFLREEEGRRSGVGGYLRVERRFVCRNDSPYLDLICSIRE